MTAYRRTKNFQADLGDATDHNALNAELDAIARRLDVIGAKLDTIQKDDNTLAAGIVLPDALSAEVRNLMAGTDMLLVKGPKGDTGASFRADYRGMLAEKYTFDDQVQGFCFLAIDTGQLFIKLSGASGDWSQPYAFAKGATGEKGDTGAKGDPGANGLPGVVASVDGSDKTAYLTGRSRIVGRLELQDGILTLVLTTS